MRFTDTKELTKIISLFREYYPGARSIIIRGEYDYKGFRGFCVVVTLDVMPVLATVVYGFPLVGVKSDTWAKTTLKYSM